MSHLHSSIQAAIPLVLQPYWPAFLCEFIQDFLEGIDGRMDLLGLDTSHLRGRVTAFPQIRYRETIHQILESHSKINPLIIKIRVRPAKISSANWPDDLREIIDLKKDLTSYELRDDITDYLLKHLAGTPCKIYFDLKSPSGVPIKIEVPSDKVDWVSTLINKEIDGIENLLPRDVINVVASAD